MEEGVNSMADEAEPKEGTTKKEGKKLLPGISKVPLDGILLVVVPFIGFMLLFLHLLGFLPPQPVVIHVIDSGLARGAEAIGEVELPVEAGVTPRQAVSSESTPEEDEAANGGESAGAAGLVTTGGPTDRESRTGSVETPAVTLEPPVPAAARDQTEPMLTGDESQDKKVKQLAKVYEQMNAASVAAIVTNMSDDEAVDILSNMKPRNAAKVLASLNPERAAALSLMLAR
jgi:hypothetical protein